MIVAVCVFSLFHPVELDIKPARGSVLVVNHERIVEGSAAVTLRGRSIVTGRDGANVSFTLSIPGKIRRQFYGTLEVREMDGYLVPIVRMPLETAVASIVAAETPSAPEEARKAQAVVARSFLTAAHNRHQGFDFCDTTHCQFLRDAPSAATLNSKVASATKDLVLAYQGRPFAALYSANCGGRTRTPQDAGWNQEPYPYFGVDCPIHGPASGHRIGMCQEGAAELARQGKSFREILAFYFPAAAVTSDTDVHAAW